MTNKNDIKWHEKYIRLRSYLSVHHQLPDKRKEENRELFNWWKYNSKQLRQGKLTSQKEQLLSKLNSMRADKKIEF